MEVPMDDTKMTEEATQAGEHNSSDDEAILQQAKRHWRSARTHWRQWREEARLCYSMEAGDQWDDADRIALEDKLQIPVTFNRISPMVDVVVGTEIGNRREVRYIPRTKEDAGPNEIYSAAADFFRDECEAEHEDTDAFRDACICGIGCCEVRMDYAEDPTGTIIIERVDPKELWPDPDAKKNNLADQQFMFRIRDVPFHEIKATWPDDASDVYGMHHKGSWDADDDQDDNDIHLNISGDQYALGVDNESAERFHDYTMMRLVEYQYSTKVAVYIVQNEYGELDKLTKAEFAEFRFMRKAMGAPVREDIDYKKTTQKIIKRMFIIGNKVMQHDVSPAITNFTYLFITSKRDSSKASWYGMVRPMIDPQKWANKFFSQIIHILNTSAKSGAYVETSAVEDVRKFERNFAKTGSVLWLEDGGLDRVRERGFGNYPSGIDKMMEFSLNSMREVTGINIELMGLSGKSQAGVLEYQRKQAALTILGMLFDNLRRYRKMQGEVLLYYIDNYVSDGRLVRIVGPEGKKYVPLSKQPGFTKYDVVIDEAPSSPNQKERTFEVLMQLLPAMMKMGYAPPVEILDYLPLPETLVEAMKEQQKQMMQQPSPEQQKAEFEAQAKQQELQMQMQGKQQELELEKISKEMELQFEGMKQQQQMGLDAASRQQQMGIEAAEAEQDMAININKTELEIAIKETLGKLAIAQKAREARLKEMSARQRRGE